MKLYITVNKPIPNGYSGIDLATQKVDFGKMDTICESAECTEIILDETLPYVMIKQLPNLLKQIISRLRKNGKLIINDVDLDAATNMYNNGLLNMEEINLLLYSSGTLNKCGVYSHTNIRLILEQLNLTTISVDLDSCNYTLIAQRK